MDADLTAKQNKEQPANDVRAASRQRRLLLSRGAMAVVAGGRVVVAGRRPAWTNASL